MHLGPKWKMVQRRSGTAPQNTSHGPKQPPSHRLYCIIDHIKRVTHVVNSKYFLCLCSSYTTLFFVLCPTTRPDIQTQTSQGFSGVSRRVSQGMPLQRPQGRIWHTTGRPLRSKSGRLRIAPRMRGSPQMRVDDEGEK